MAAFQEVFRRSGIDERRSPPGMVVPFGGANIVALIDPGRKLKVEPNAHALEIKEIDGAEIRKRMMQVRNTFSEPDTDPQLRAASLPATFNGDARFFEIKGTRSRLAFPAWRWWPGRPAGREGSNPSSMLPCCQKSRLRWRSAMSWFRGAAAFQRFTPRSPATMNGNCRR
jgi:hypothetical protein